MADEYITTVSDTHIVFTLPPAPPAPVVLRRRVSKLEYIARFTAGELRAIYSAAKTSVDVEIYLAKFNAVTPDPDGTSIDLDDPRLIAGLRDLEAAGCLAAGRANQIVA